MTLQHTSPCCIHGSASSVGRFVRGRGSLPPVRKKLYWPGRAAVPTRRGIASVPPDLGTQMRILLVTSFTDAKVEGRKCLDFLES